MKVKSWPAALVSTSFLANPNNIMAGYYRVRKGDHFTNIVEKYSVVNNHINYSQMLALFLKLNGKHNLSDFNRIRINQKIKVPSQEDIENYLTYYQSKYPSHWNPGSWKIKKARKYRVKPGDTFSKIAKYFIPNVPMKGANGSIKFLAAKNHAIHDIDKIYVGQEISIPEEAEILAFQNKVNQKKRLPATIKKKKVIQDKNHQNHLKLSPRTQAPTQNQDHSPLYKKGFELLDQELLHSKDRLETITCLKNMLELSRQYGRDDLEDYFLKLISLFIDPKKEKQFLSLLKNYFKINEGTTSFS